ncbi:UNVERIFIED_ORG: hypothetical protein ABIC62_002157 [Burkholderia sp. 1595]|uniref:Insertion element IS150 protein InsJ-like helix-turn-helix domain-containing protein n=1 Tax=Paraburkholderia terricola TaxID=169427 RepID=A0ABU1LTE4_9BURK|nr:hypothetical protein [Paraburkholderia terricola]MDR6480885.1 hypothetical protein [Paraburkholderia terricola]
MSFRQEFVHLAGQHTLTVTELCERFNISRQTGYKWLKRGEDALADRQGRGEADGGPHGAKNYRCLPWQTHPRRTQCGVGADDGLVTEAECARDHPFIAPLPPPSQETRFKSWRCEPLSLPTFFAAAKKVGAAPHRGNTNRPLTNQEKAKKQDEPNQKARRTKPKSKNQPNQNPAEQAKNPTPRRGI